MKTRTKQNPRQFKLEIFSYGNSYYIDRVIELEKALARKPRQLRLDLVGVGEISADAALRIRAALLARSPKTKIITKAHSSLQNGSVLVWLLGDQRLMRDDATVYFRRANLTGIKVAEPDEAWKEEQPDYHDADSDVDPEEGDHARVLQLINEFLPVNELAGRIVGTPVLRQFGLVQNEQVDNFLATAFAKSEQPKSKRALIPR
jgi:hypothetical protein